MFFVFLEEKKEGKKGERWKNLKKREKKKWKLQVYLSL